uniref:Uncharacterized protein n=1 Tax=Palpitomonas bilix TaxID=652834 RepID=A0A7S3LTW0_9EUKA
MKLRQEKRHEHIEHDHKTQFERVKYKYFNLFSDESPSRGRLFLSCLLVGFSSVQNLQPVCNSLSHPHMHVCLRALNMIQEVVAEAMNIRDDRVLLVGIVPLKQSWDKLLSLLQNS